MTELYLQSIRDLPQEWIKDGTYVTQFQNTCLALNENLDPLIYENGKWEKLNLDHNTKIGTYFLNNKWAL